MIPSTIIVVLFSTMVSFYPHSFLYGLCCVWLDANIVEMQCPVMLKE